MLRKYRKSLIGLLLVILIGILSIYFYRAKFHYNPKKEIMLEVENNNRYKITAINLESEEEIKVGSYWAFNNKIMLRKSKFGKIDDQEEHFLILLENDDEIGVGL